MATHKQDDNTHGHLVIVGGSEDRERDKPILSRFIELSGGKDALISVITAASSIPRDVWSVYERAFRDLGVKHMVPVHLSRRAQANDPKVVQTVASSNGIFMTGGDQKRLLATIGGTDLDAAMHSAYRERGACIGGTSAGASAVSGHMLAAGEVGLRPTLGSVHLAAGLGFLKRVVVDQHFSERRRLVRLLTVVAQNPYLQGIGIDEDTALIIERGGGVEVLGAGSVTIVDGRSMITNAAEDLAANATPRLIDVRLHLLPAGTRFEVGQEGAVPVPLEDIMLNLVGRSE